MSVVVEKPRAATRTMGLTMGSFEWSAALASLWLVAGLHLDGWAHIHKPGLESFFTPWHGILYTGFFALAGVLVVGWRSGHADRLSMMGVATFLVGGVGDLLWHTFFGIEVNIEALLSPTHLALAVGMALMVSAPLRNAWRSQRRSPGIPALLSAGLLLSLLSFFTQFLHPGGRPWPLVSNRPTEATIPVASPVPNFPVFPNGVPTTEMVTALAVGGILVELAIVLLLVLPLARRFELPFGSLALVLTLNGALLAAMRDTPFFIPVALVAGLAGDAALRLARGRAWKLHATAGGLVAAWSLAYFAALAASGGVWWSIHAWAGAVALATLLAIGLSVALQA